MKSKHNNQTAGGSPKVLVLKQLLAQARFIRRNDKPEVAIAAAEIESRLQKDLDEAIATAA